MKKYKKIIIPTLSLFLTSCGGGGGSTSSPPPLSYPPDTTNNSNIPSTEQSEPSETDNNTSADIDLSLPLPLPSHEGHIPESANGHHHSPIPPSAPELPVPAEPNTLVENVPSPPLPNNEHAPYKEIHHITSIAPVALDTPKHNVNDEHSIKDIGIIDSSYYLSDTFKNEKGDNRLKRHNQSSLIQEKPNSHGTMVAAVINRYNKTATLHAYSAYHNSDERLWVDNQDYDRAYQKGARIFNNSYGSNTTTSIVASNPGYNIVQYAKIDSIVVWAAGNENQDHATPQSLYPMVDDDARNGWISVAEADYSQGYRGTVNREIYGNNSASNYIGEQAKNWGIAAQGEHILSLKDQKQPTKFHSYRVKGTSFAAPRVTAAAANVWAKFPWMDNHLVVVSLLSSADKPGTFLPNQDGVCHSEQSQECGIPTEGPEANFGWGLLNERRALKGPARFDTRLLTNKDAKTTADNFVKNTHISANKENKDLLVVNFDFRHYQNQDKLTWSNNIKGDAGILKQGLGTLYLNGQNTYQGKTIIDGGVLGIGHSLTSEVIINQGGTLLAEFDKQKYKNENKKVVLGSPTPPTNYTLKNNGSLNVYGEGLTINGNYLASGNSRIVIDIDKSNLDVTGTMDLGNSSQIIADIKELDSNIIPSQQGTDKTIISAGTITNYQNVRYAKSDKINPYIDISQLYIKAEKEIKVSYKRNTTAYVLKKINHTPKSANHTADNIDKVLDTLAENKELNAFGVKAASLLRIAPERLSSVIDSLSGEIYASSQQILINQNLLTNQVLSQRLMSVNRSTKNGLWLDSIYANNYIKQDGYATAKVKTVGSQIGFDRKLSENLTLGVALNQSTVRAKFNRDAGDNKTKNIGAFLYGSYDFSQFYLATMAGMNYASSQINRVVFDEHANTTFSSRIYNLYAELGKHIHLGNAHVNPFIGYSLNHIKRGSFKENMAFGINAQSKNYNLNSFMLGIRSAVTFDKLTLSAKLSHAYTPKDNELSFDAKFTGFDNNISIRGAEQNKHLTWLGLGMSYELLKELSLQLNYHLSIKEDKKEHEIISLGATYRF